MKKFWTLLLLVIFAGIAVLLIVEKKPDNKLGVYLEPGNWSLGEVELGKKSSAPIKIKNNSIVKYEIVKVRPSCECITAKITQNITDKYSDGIVDVEITAKKELGTHFKAFIYISLQEVDGEKEPVLLRFDISGSIKGSKYDLKDTEILLFRTQKAIGYEIVQEKLGLIRQKYPELKIREYLLDNTENYRLLAVYEKEFSVKERDDIQMFKGNYYFTGNEALRELNKMLSSGQINFEPSENALQILFFYSSVCKECRDVRENFLPEIRAKYRSKIDIKELDILERGNYEQLVALENSHRIEANKLMSVFLGNEYILGKFQIEKNLDSAISRLLENPEEANIAVPVKKYGSIKEKFQKFGVLAVILAGLQDGINPCVFATIIFFISFLTFAERTRREILCIGIFYILTVFTTYLLLGIGFFKAVQTLSAYETYSKVFFIITMVLMFLFAALSLYDLIIYWKTRQSKNILDANGNQVKKTKGAEILTWTYDFENRQIAYSDPMNTGQYWYDAGGRRIKKLVTMTTFKSGGTQNAGTKIGVGNGNGQGAQNGQGTQNAQQNMTQTETINERYFYDGANIVADYDATGALQATYVTPFLDQNLTKNIGISKYYYMQDGLGSVRNILNSVQIVQNSYDYTAFGEILNWTEFIANRYSYTSREWDKETLAYYYRNRYYFQQNGRFGQKDLFEGSSNLYFYVRNLPVTFTDPFGLWIDTGNNIWTAVKGDTLWGLASQYGDGFDWPCLWPVGETKDHGYPDIIWEGDCYDASNLAAPPPYNTYSAIISGDLFLQQQPQFPSLIAPTHPSQVAKKIQEVSGQGATPINLLHVSGHNSAINAQAMSGIASGTGTRELFLAQQVLDLNESSSFNRAKKRQGPVRCWFTRSAKLWFIGCGTSGIAETFCSSILRGSAETYGATTNNIFDSQGIATYVRTEDRSWLGKLFYKDNTVIIYSEPEKAWKSSSVFKKFPKGMGCK